MSMLVGMSCWRKLITSISSTCPSGNSELKRPLTQTSLRMLEEHLLILMDSEPINSNTFASMVSDGVIVMPRLIPCSWFLAPWHGNYAMPCARLCAFPGGCSGARGRSARRRLPLGNAWTWATWALAVHRSRWKTRTGPEPGCVGHGQGKMIFLSEVPTCSYWIFFFWVYTAAKHAKKSTKKNISKTKAKVLQHKWNWTHQNLWVTKLKAIIQAIMRMPWGATWTTIKRPTASGIDSR